MYDTTYGNDIKMKAKMKGKWEKSKKKDKSNQFNRYKSYKYISMKLNNIEYLSRYEFELGKDGESSSSPVNLAK